MRVHCNDIKFFGDLAINACWPERYPYRLTFEKTIVLHCRSWYTESEEDVPEVSAYAAERKWFTGNPTF